MSGLVYVIHCSLPTARRNALCSSSLSGWSWSAVVVFSAAVPGAVAGLQLHLCLMETVCQSKFVVVSSVGDVASEKGHGVSNRQSSCWSK